MPTNLRFLVRTTQHPDNSVTRSRYNSRGQPTATWGSLAYATVYSHDYAGRVLTLRTTPDIADNEPTDSGGAVTYWRYDPATGRLTGKFYDYEGTVPTNGPTYDHTSAGRLASRTWKRGITTAYYYDLAGDLRAVDYSDTATPDVFHTRDRLGRATTSAQGTLAVAAGTLPVATGGITVTAIRSATYGYDPATLAPATEAVDYGGGFTQTLTRTYEDGAGGTISGRPNGHTFAGGSATWTYDNAGRPSTLTDGTDTFTYGYQPGSNLIKTVTGPAHTVANTYESSRDVLASKINAINDTNIPSSFSYGVNAIGQRETVGPVLDDSNNSISTYAPKWIWDYNDSGELIEANDQTASNDRAYQYDAIGNRQKTVNGLAAALPTAPTNYQANALNQYTVANGITLPIAPAPAPYDPDGNLRFDGGVNKDSENREYLWDAENRLIEVRVAGAAALVTYAYDHLSRLISRTAAGSTTHYLYDGWNRIAEYSGQTAEKTYLWGMDLSGSMQGAGGVGGLLSVSQEGSVFYPTYDGNGNVSEYITSAGTVAAHFEYDPFGNLVASNDTSNRFPYRFSTKPQDSATGLLYFGYRWYDPLTGRWPSRDTIEEEGGLNLYGFVGNDGVDKIDEIGMIPRRVKTPYPDMHAAAHAAGMKALLQAEKDYKELLDRKNAPNATAEDRKFSEPRPPEHGGRICEHCEIDTDGSKTITYYATETVGPPPSKAPAGASAVIQPNKAPNCEVGDKEVAFWHTHPSDPAWDYDKKRNKIFYWSGASSFSTGDLDVTDGIKSRTGGSGPYVIAANHPDNPRGLPLFVTYRKDKSFRGEIIVTELYIRMPQRDLRSVDNAIYYVQ